MEVLFVLRLNQSSKLKPATIYCRITIDGVRAGDFSTFMKVIPDHWHSRGQCITSGTLEAEQDNERLTNIRTALKKILNSLEKEDKKVTAYQVKEAYLKKAIPDKTLLEAYHEFIERQDKLLKVDKVAKNTMKGYRSRYSILQTYLKKLNKENLPFESVSLKFAHQYELFLKTKEKSCGQNAAMKHIRGISQVLEYSVKQEYILNNPLEAFPYTFEKAKPPVPLSRKELHLLESYRFVSESLQKVTDGFIFMCYTGFAYIDYATFNPDEHLSEGEGENEYWIMKDRVKSDERALLPLFSKAKEILKKYDNKLPVISNQKKNKYLKEVAEIVGIKKKLTTKVARQTAAQIWLDAGVNAETVARMLGQTNTKVLLTHYANVSRKRISLEVQKLVS